MNLKAAIQCVRYKYLMTEKDRREFRLTTFDIPKFRLSIHTLTTCSEKDADVIVKECERIAGNSARKIYDLIDIVDINLARGVPYGAVLAMLKGWFSNEN